MAKYTITRRENSLTGRISLPASKSISNRLLLIRALCNSGIEPENLSAAEDTLLLRDLLKQIETVQSSDAGQPLNQDPPHTADPSISCHSFDCRNAGTVMRFLTAFLANRPGAWILSGSDRMQKRPVGILVEALRSLGASIDYTGTPGYPPIKIHGKPLAGGEVAMDVSVSSQFVSALLMIAPCLPHGLTIRITGRQVSFPYINLTIRMMEDFGVAVEQKGDLLTVRPGGYRPELVSSNSYAVEADWSSAAFWYEAAALADSAEILLPGLHKNSFQGDAEVAELFKPLGVETIFVEEGVKLMKAQGTGHRAQDTKHREQDSTLFPVILRPSSLILHPSTLDLSAYPDLAPSLIVTCAALGIPVRFTGLHHLSIKESDRLLALVTELEKLSIVIRHPASGILETVEQTPQTGLIPNAFPVTIEPYGDHRIAMAFAILAQGIGSICITDPSVVAKSYPGFWEDMRRIGFDIREM